MVAVVKIKILKGHVTHRMSNGHRTLQLHPAILGLRICHLDHNDLVLVEDIDVAYKSLSKTLHNMKMLQSKNIRLNYISKFHCVMF